MVSDIAGSLIKIPEPVLILVLMEYGLWQEVLMFTRFAHWVLILVLMEYGLWQKGVVHLFDKAYVLILVLMEYGLWPIKLW